MTEDMVLNAIKDFMENMPTWYAYPSIKKYNFTARDKAIIKEKIILFQKKHQNMVEVFPYWLVLICLE